jgi:predicted RNA-binding Zn-ribbon protein involved in translation (DUF1610 family)
MVFDEKWTSYTVGKRMAKFDHVQFICDNCGIAFYPRRKMSRFLHWFSCSIIYKLGFGTMKLALSLTNNNFKKNKSKNSTLIYKEQYNKTLLVIL